MNSFFHFSPTADEKYPSSQTSEVPWNWIGWRWKFIEMEDPQVTMAFNTKSWSFLTWIWMYPIPSTNTHWEYNGIFTYIYGEYVL